MIQVDHAHLEVTGESEDDDEGVQHEWPATLVAVHVGFGMLVASRVQEGSGGTPATLEKFAATMVTKLLKHACLGNAIF